jgi:Flp pilus assembly protein TadD
MSDYHSKIVHFKPLIFLAIIVFLVYSNTLNSAFQLDDYHNITKNTQIQMSSLSLDSIIDSFYAAPDWENAYRPFAFFTFALNWRFGGNDVTGFHLVNIFIHLFTAFFLFLSVSQLLCTPNIRSLDNRTIHFIALLSATLWCIHPIQIQAVTYIVQRMASMAALFYVIGVFCYLKGRANETTVYRLIWYSCCGLSFLFAIGSKNNAIMLPVVLLLMEFIFFRDLSNPKIQKRAVAMLVMGAMFIVVAGILIFMNGNFSHYFDKIYEVRPFTWQQRLLTQPSVLLFYLFQIFYPIADQFSITHDFPLSTSFFNPWTTLPAILIVAALIGVAFWRIKKNPILSFAILFYFGNHVIESSILPLEMVFEHRNYLPTLFLFVPIAIGIKDALDYYYSVKKPMFSFLAFSLCAVLIGLGVSTYVRNWDWRSVKSIWEDAMRKAPLSARPPHNLAYGYYEPSGQIDKALELYQKALNLAANQTIFRADTYNNIASIYFSELKDYEKAIDYAKKAIAIYPLDTSHYILCDSLSLLGRYDQAMTFLEELLEKYPNDNSLLYRNGFLRLKTGNPEEAIKFLQACLQKAPENWKYLRDIGFCLTRLEKYEKAYRFLKRAQNSRPESVGILLGIVENRKLAAKPEAAVKSIDQLIDLIGVENTEDLFKNILEDPLGLPVMYEEVIPLVSERIREKSKELLFFADRLEIVFL